MTPMSMGLIGRDILAAPEDTPTSRPPQRRVLIIVVTVALAMAAYWLTRSSLNEMAARMLAILIIAAVFWATEVLPLFATALVVIGLEVLLLASTGGLADVLTGLLTSLGLAVHLSPDVRPIAAGTFLNPFASDVIILFMGGFLLSAAMTKHGVDKAIASIVLRPFTRSPLLLIYGLLGMSAFSSMWMSNTAAAAMMIAIASPLVGIVPHGDRFLRAIFLAVAFGTNIGGIGTPIGTPPNAIAFGTLNAAGHKVTFLKWMLVAVPLEILLLGITGLLLYAFFRPDQALKLGEIRPAQKLSAHGKAALVILWVTVLFWVTSGQHGLKPGITALLAAAALAALRVVDRRDVDSIAWSILILIWGGLSLGIGMEQSGLTGYLWRIDLAAVPGGMWGVAILVTLVAVSMSTVMSNTASAALLVPMAMAIALPEPELFVMLAALACSFAMALPVSTPPNAIAYATGHIPVAVMMRTGGLISIIAAGLMLIGYRIMLPLLF